MLSLKRYPDRLEDTRFEFSDVDIELANLLILKLYFVERDIRCESNFA